MKQLLLLFLLMGIVGSAVAQETTWSVNIAPSVSYRLPQSRSPKNRSSGTALLHSQTRFSNNYVDIAYPDIRVPQPYIIDFIQNYLEIPFFVTRKILENDKFQLYPMVGITNSLLLSEKNRVAEDGRAHV